MAPEDLLKEGLNIKESLGINYTDVWNSIPTEVLEKVNLGLDLGLIALVIGVIYAAALLIIFVLRLFFGTRESRALGRIEGKLEDIVGMLGRKKTEKKEIKKKKK